MKRISYGNTTTADFNTPTNVKIDGSNTNLTLSTAFGTSANTGVKATLVFSMLNVSQFTTKTFTVTPRIVENVTFYQMPSQQVVVTTDGDGACIISVDIDILDLSGSCNLEVTLSDSASDTIDVICYVFQGVTDTDGIAQADVAEIATDSTAAGNLKLQYNGTGYQSLGSPSLD